VQDESKKTTYLRRVPALNAYVTADSRKSSHGTLSLPAVFGDEAVGTVGAGDRGQSTAGIIVAGVV
tara:strand:+ start:2239 stop:2436 length:198 start_codon:yes stop_codon:yes gene_type:complete